MKLKKLKFRGFYLFSFEGHKDERGSFRRHLCKDLLKKNNINLDIKQGNLSHSFKKGTLRGFHFKKGKSNETKIMSPITGSIFHVAIDLRKESKTCKKTFGITLDSKNRESIIVPPHCANAILTLEDDTIMHYYMSDYFEEKKYSGIRYNDPFWKIKWPIKPKIINFRDKNYPNFKF